MFIYNHIVGINRQRELVQFSYLGCLCFFYFFFDSSISLVCIYTYSYLTYLWYTLCQHAMYTVMCCIVIYMYYILTMCNPILEYHCFKELCIYKHDLYILVNGTFLCACKSCPRFLLTGHGDTGLSPPLMTKCPFIIIYYSLCIYSCVATIVQSILFDN